MEWLYQGVDTDSNPSGCALAISDYDRAHILKTGSWFRMKVLLALS